MPSRQDRMLCLLEGKGLMSRKKLYDALKEMQSQGFKIKLPSDYKKLSNEVYGKRAMIYLTWADKDERKRGERELMRRGFKVQESYWPGSATSEVQVSYFKGWHWDE